MAGVAELATTLSPIELDPMPSSLPLATVSSTVDCELSVMATTGCNGVVKHVCGCNLNEPVNSLLSTSLMGKDMQPRNSLRL